ncbi:MAG: hypothetical protein INQ03_14620 [Candidatus Heimdallarchaeota archaeon]|nr:hypothetical protein [Candidatus Heimdallarchaeota archaeon]
MHNHLSFEECKKLETHEQLSHFFCPHLPKTKETFELTNVILKCLDLEKKGIYSTPNEISAAKDLISFVKANARDYKKFKTEITTVDALQKIVSY